MRKEYQLNMWHTTRQWAPKRSRRQGHTTLFEQLKISRYHCKAPRKSMAHTILLFLIYMHHALEQMIEYEAMVNVATCSSWPCSCVHMPSYITSCTSFPLCTYSCGRRHACIPQQMPAWHPCPQQAHQRGQRSVRRGTTTFSAKICSNSCERRLIKSWSWNVSDRVTPC